MEAFHKYILLILITIFISAGCTKKETEKRKLDLQTCNCHDFSAITGVRSDESRGVLEWLKSSGSGLQRNTTFIPRPLDNLTFQWVKRGRHPEDTQTCEGCHLLENVVEGHTLSIYPADVLGKLYSPGTDCASACHSWLGDNVSSGEKFSGSFRPGTLLDSGDNAHSRIFKEGFRGDPANLNLNLVFLPPGCGGCHNFGTTKHGWIPVCLDCHTFLNTTATGTSKFTSLHDEHSTLSQNVCNNCHSSQEPPDEQSRGVCYNCHLSGHNPDIVF